MASKCGLTPQYESLEKLYQAKRAAGLQILGVAANDFNGQEPGTDTEIATFCSISYAVTFPLFSKIAVVGADKHPLAQPTATGEGPMRERLQNSAIQPHPPPEALWNFEKFLIARDGSVAERFAPDVAADDPRLLAAVERELAKPSDESAGAQRIGALNRSHSQR